MRKVALDDLKLLAVVALLTDIPEKNLRRGEVGTVVETLAPDVYEVEFSGDQGRCYATAAVDVKALLQLHQGPAHAAA